MSSKVNYSKTLLESGHPVMLLMPKGAAGEGAKMCDSKGDVKGPYVPSAIDFTHQGNQS